MACVEAVVLLLLLLGMGMLGVQGEADTTSLSLSLEGLLEKLNGTKTATCADGALTGALDDSTYEALVTAVKRAYSYSSQEPLSLLLPTSLMTPILRQLAKITAAQLGSTVLVETLPQLPNTTRSAYQIYYDGFSDGNDYVARVWSSSETPLVSNDSLLLQPSLVPMYAMGNIAAASVLEDSQVLPTMYAPLQMFGSWMTLFYNTVLMAHSNETMPATWQDLLSLAQRVNGTDLDGDGEPEWALCIDLAPGCKAQNVLGAIYATMAQTEGKQQGIWFNKQTFQPLFPNPAMAEALRLLRELSKYGSTDTCAVLNERFALGKCLFTLEWLAPYLFESSSNPQYKIRGKVNATRVPGSRIVWAGQNASVMYEPSTPGSGLTPCASATSLQEIAAGNATLCRNAKEVPTASGDGVHLVNRPSVASSVAVSWGMVTAATNETARRTAASIFMNQAVTLYNQIMNTGITLVNAIVYGYNSSQLTLTPEQLAATEDASVVMPLVVELIHENLTDATEIGIPFNQLYRLVLDTMAIMAIHSSDQDIGGIMDEGLRNFSFVQKVCPLNNTMLLFYNATLGITYTAPSPPAAPAAHVNNSLSIVLPSVLVPALVAAVVASVLLWMHTQRMKRGHKTLLGKTRPPGVGAATTLVVTDIQSSTVLWEALPADVMDAAIRQHHRCIRALLGAHQGYESATEGDSFICSFHQPCAAVAFCSATQVALRDMEWPPELLRHPEARLVIVRGSAVPDAQLEPARLRSRLFLRRSLSSKQMSCAEAPRSQLVNGRLSQRLGDSMQQDAPSTPSVARTPRSAALLALRLQGGSEQPPQQPQPVSAARQQGGRGTDQRDGDVAGSAQQGGSFSSLGATKQSAWSGGRSPAVSTLQAVVTADAAAADGSGSIQLVDISSGDFPAVTLSLVEEKLPVATSHEVSLTADVRTGATSDLAAAEAMVDGLVTKAISDVRTERLQRLLPTSAFLDVLTSALSQAPGVSGSTAMDVHPETGGSEDLSGEQVDTTTGEDSSATLAHALGWSWLELLSAWHHEVAASSPAEAAGDRDADQHALLTRGRSKPSMASSDPAMKSTTVIFQGLRVRMGVHSGVLSADEVTVDRATQRVQYTGAPLQVAKAVADAGQGGMVLLSASTFMRLQHNTLSHTTSTSPDQKKRRMQLSNTIFMFGGRHDLGLPFGRTVPGLAHSTHAEGLASTSPASVKGRQGLDQGQPGGCLRQLFFGKGRSALTPPSTSSGQVQVYGNDSSYRQSRPSHRQVHSLTAVNSSSSPGCIDDASNGGAAAGSLSQDRKTPDIDALQPHGNFGHATASSWQRHASLARALRTANVVSQRFSPNSRAMALQRSAAIASETSRELPGHDLYMSVPLALYARLGHFGPIRSKEQLLQGTLHAPAPAAAIAFMHAYGASTLLAEVPDAARTALNMFRTCVLRQLSQANGYLVETADGFVLAAFAQPAPAIAWALACSEDLNRQPWPKAILEHELGMELVELETCGPASHRPSSSAQELQALHVPADHQAAIADAARQCAVRSSSSGPDNTTVELRDRFSSLAGHTYAASAVRGLHGGGATNLVTRVRGIRLRCGIDVGIIKPEVHPVTGRMVYRGRVMNRSARISSKAGPGQVLASAVAFQLSQDDDTLGAEICGVDLGPFDLKGVAEPIELVKCRRGLHP